MRHRIRIFKGRRPSVERWYVSCSRCGDEWVPIGPEGYYGRQRWDLALALGLAHQRMAGARH